MFSSAGLFKDVSCPRHSDCNLLSCIFLHSPPRRDYADGRQEQQVYDPATSARRASPPLKKRRLDSEHDERAEQKSPDTSSAAEPTRLVKGPSKIKPERKELIGSRSKPSPKMVVTRSIERSVSPPPSRRMKQSFREKTQPLSRPISQHKESLNPRMVPRAPEVHARRQAFLQKLHEQIDRLNTQNVAETGGPQSSILDAQEIITLALDEEEALAKQHGEGIYRSAIAGRITSLKKMSMNDWRSYLSQKLPDKSPVAGGVEHSHTFAKSVLIGLGSELEQIAVLHQLRTPLQGLETYGYVTVPPTPSEISKASAGVKAAAGFEVCDRCGTRFQVFPGRDDSGRLTSQGTCHYHWAKAFRPARLQTDRSQGQQEASFPCCNKGLGTEGCTLAEHHVFKVSDPKRLASILQFQRTPLNSCPPADLPLAISYDCEMGYTTLGMELIRLTAVAWPDGEGILDVLVRPQGEILDLNTRFSGVSAEQYGSAVAFEMDQAKNGSDTSGGSKVEPILQKVGSPSVARGLLFDLLTPDTPLIGHAIENDLNTCRIIHPFVIDTVLLYPHPRGLPIRYRLRMLASKYLERAIQTEGQTGHDSKEDAIATGDLVSLKVREKWKSLQQAGWKFKDGSLFKPSPGDEEMSMTSKQNVVRR